ncbi:unnamed protein product [Prunus armeniaca]
MKRTRVKFASLVFMKMNICHTSKDSWFEHYDRGQGPLLSKHLDRSTEVQDMKRHTVEQINSRDNGIILVVARDMSPNEECTGCFKEMTIFLFCNLILLWGLRTSHFMENVMRSKVHLKVMVDIFASLC